MLYCFSKVWKVLQHWEIQGALRTYASGLVSTTAEVSQLLAQLLAQREPGPMAKK